MFDHPRDKRRDQAAPARQVEPLDLATMGLFYFNRVQPDKKIWYIDGNGQLQHSGTKGGGLRWCFACNKPFCAKSSKTKCPACGAEQVVPPPADKGLAAVKAALERLGREADALTRTSRRRRSSWP